MSTPLLGVELVTPEQFAPRRPLSGAERLCWAVLEAVIHDLGRPEPLRLSGRRPQESLQSRAVTYLWTHDPCWPFSFDNLCERLDIDPDAFRDAVNAKLRRTAA